MSKHGDVEITIRPTGRVYHQPIPKGPDERPRTREERESRERDAWAHTKERLKRHEGMSETQADDACRKAREREHAKKRARGEEP